jgi:Kdo2-lipid IVA lauroyltransferase/acyltransferase
MAKRSSKNVQYLVYLGFRVLAFLFHLFPINANLRTARFFGWLWYRTLRRHRQRAIEHLRHAYGNSLSNEELERIALRSCQQMAMMAMELLFTPRLITPWTWSKYIRVGPDITEAIRYLVEGKTGVIMVTGHYGNWELVGYAMACVGLDIAAVMRPLDNPYFNDYTVRTRAAGGLKLIYKKGMTEIAEEILAKGGSVGFIADQNAGHKGLFVDFFGRKASTYKSIGLLAREYNVPIMVGCARRISNKLQYEVEVTRIIYPHEWQGKQNEVLWITQEYTKAIEQFVRKDPSQYLWVHRRWKTRPPEEPQIDKQSNEADIEQTA